MHNNLYKRISLLILLLGSLAVNAAPVADIANTKHNLSATGAGTVTATTEDQICVFCHTPHAATVGVSPLWNKELSTADGSYTLYSSDSIDAILEQPGGSSKLCLSCHDGAMMIGKVNVLEGVADVTIAMSGLAGDSTMPAGDGVTSGFTRDLGVDLSNDHPISFDYTTALDSEIYDPSAVSHIDNRTSGVHPTIPLENDQVQCISCHDPHVKDDAGEDIKFLRLNRIQKVASPTDGSFNSTNDIICLGCHKKAGWANSAHANSDADVANEIYTNAAATQRDFKTGIKVWEAACLNCHDTHTVEGARKLLREGTDSGATPKAGGNPAQEETCYQCHDVTGNSILDSANNDVPDIKSDFALTTAMPIDNTTEVHSISDEDFTESTTLLGKGNLSNRHVECTDCHNPHRVIKNKLFNADPSSPDAEGTHTHVAGTQHTNIASGVLTGTTGVEPVYGSAAWGAGATSYTLKKGVPTVGGSTDAASSYVTREYQVCLKCHSDYAWDSAPVSGPSIGINGLTQYTDQAMEFQAPAGDQGEATADHRSWHPVIDATGRTTAIRAGMNANNFTAPFNTGVGAQTMYCTDCHGSETAMGTSAPVDPAPWGPHGSGKDFILKGNWDVANATMGADATSTNGVSLCFRCHDYNAYSNVNSDGAAYQSGFSGTTAGGCGLGGTNPTSNMHIGHRNRIGKDLRCSWCHVAVPHGWQNKALLVDVTQSATVDNCGGNRGNINDAVSCNNPPYYVNAMLGGNSADNPGVAFQTSGNWVSTNCGGGSNQASWMNRNCGAPP